MNFKNVKSININGGIGVNALYFDSLRVWVKQQITPEKTIVYLTDGSYRTYDIQGVVNRSNIWNIAPENTRKIVFGSTVTTLDQNAFVALGLNDLEEVYFNDVSSPITIFSNFTNLPSLRKVSFPALCIFQTFESGSRRGYGFFEQCPNVEVEFRGLNKEQVEMMTCYPFGLDEDRVYGTEENPSYSKSQLEELIMNQTGASNVVILSEAYPMEEDSFVVLPGIGPDFNVQCCFSINPSNDAIALIGNTSAGSNSFFGQLGYQQFNSVNSMFCGTGQWSCVRDFSLEQTDWYEIRYQVSRGQMSTSQTSATWQTCLKMTGEETGFSEEIFHQLSKYENSTMAPVYLWRMRDWNTYAKSDAGMKYAKGGSRGEVFFNVVPVEIDGEVQFFDLVSNQILEKSGSFGGVQGELSEKQMEMWNISKDADARIVYNDGSEREISCPDGILYAWDIPNVEGAVEIHTSERVSSMDGTFEGNPSLRVVDLPAVVTWAASSFKDCTSLESVYAPNLEPHTYDMTFMGCTSLREVVLDKPVNIQSQTFRGCTSLERISINALRFSSYCFADCTSLKVIDLTRCTSVPTLAGTNAGWFNNLPTDFKVIVPHALYNQWIATTNWTSLAAFYHILTDGVQLWENGPRWEMANIGSNSESNSGDYVMWGNTNRFFNNSGSWTSQDGSINNFSFASSNQPMYNKELSQLSEYLDSEGNLKPEYDAARVQTGNHLRMPTPEEWSSLNSECDWTYETLNRKNGWRIRGRGIYSGNSIFLPNAGRVEGTSLKNSNVNGYYWTSKFIRKNLVEDFVMTNSAHYLDNRMIYDGFPIRGVVV